MPSIPTFSTLPNLKPPYPLPLASKYLDAVAANLVRENIDLTLSIDRYSLLFISVIECRNSLLCFEVSNIELFSTFSLSISNTGSDAYEEKPRSLDLLHAFFAPNSLFLDQIGHKTLKNHKKVVECTLQVQERIWNLNQAILIRRRQI